MGVSCAYANNNVRQPWDLSGLFTGKSMTDNYKTVERYFHEQYIV